MEVELALISHGAEELFELVNMAVGILAGLGAVALLTMVKGEMGRAWRLIAAGVIVFAFAELVGGIEVLTETESLLGLDVEVWYHGLQTVFLALVVAGTAMQSRMFASASVGKAA